MATIEISTGEVIVLSDRFDVMEKINLTSPPRIAQSTEALERMIVEGTHPVVVIDDRTLHAEDLKSTVMDLAEFENDRVGGIVLLVSTNMHVDQLPDLMRFGINRIVHPGDSSEILEQLVCEARAERWQQRDTHQDGIRF